MAKFQNVLRAFVPYIVKTYKNGVNGWKGDIIEKAYEYGLDEDDDVQEFWEELLVSLPAELRGRSGPSPAKQGSLASHSGGRSGTPANVWDDRSDPKYATAPYRFTELNTQVALVPEAPPRNQLPGTLSAVLKVEWAVETPLMIGEGEGDGVQSYNLNKRWAIPGSTIRGLLRSVIETVSFSRLQQINRHRRFALRDFDHPDYQDFIKTPVDQIGAGWLTKNAEGKATITPCDWGFVEIDKVAKKEIKRFNKKEGRDVIVPWKEGKRGEKYDALGHTWKGPDALTKPRSFRGPVDGGHGKKVYSLGSGGRDGILVCTGPVTGEDAKRVYEYVFFDKAGATAVTLDDAKWLEFVLNNSKPSANKPKADGAWGELAPVYEANGRVPVFFVGSLSNQTDPDFSFGLTRLYRKPHRLSVGQMLLNGHPSHALATLNAKGEPVHQIDFAEHLFGYVHEWKDLAEGHNIAKNPDFVAPDAISRRGRIAVGFALADEGGFRAWPDKPIDTVMGAPKPSYAPFYLSGTEKDWSSPKSRLAGRKQYLVRHDGKGDARETLKTALDGTRTDKTGADQTSRVSFVVPAKDTARFRGDIRLTNVSQAELGAVLWALGLGGDAKARHLMGRAKPFGAGQVRADRVVVHVRDNATGIADPIEWHPRQGPDKVADHLTAFAKDIAKRVGMPDAKAWEASPQVQDVLAMARPHGFNAPLGEYLKFEHPDFKKPRFAGAFMHLKKRTGMTSKGAPATLLPAVKRK